MLTVHRLRGTWTNDVDLYIALSQFSKQKFVEGGIPADKIVIKPNFLGTDPGPKTGGDYFLFVGRLVDSKGIQTLLEAWSGYQSPAQLHVVGGGPLESFVRATGTSYPSIQAIGPLDGPSVIAQMKGAYALVVPSILYENFPVTIAEAFACGLPVVASRLGAMAEIVDDGRTGLLFRPGDAEDLAAKIRWAWEHPEAIGRMGQEARREYEAKYTATRNYEHLMAIYNRALSVSSGISAPMPRD
jgi:glycosyltransferase involved in cell wall biosynthesis